MPSFTLADGVNLAMRMSPDYLSVGEVRDCCTLHARSPGHAFERIASLMGIARQVPVREFILEHLWGWDHIVDSRTVDVHVRWLRQIIERDQNQPKRIVTVRGGGYRFEG